MKSKKSSGSSDGADSNSSCSPPRVGVQFVGQHSRSGQSGGGRLLARWRCLIGAFIALLFVAAAILICVAVFAYLKKEARMRTRAEEVAYLRKLVDTVNSGKDVRWKARFNPSGIRHSSFNHHKSLKNLTAIKEYVDHLERFFASEQMQNHLRQLDQFPDSNLPRHFDARKKWPLCPSIHTVPNQGGCGSCYAVSAMSVAADRTCVHTNGTQRSQLSALDVIECCAVCGNCFGGDPLKAMVYWALEGVVSGGPDGCRPYAVGTDCGTPCSPDVYGEEQMKRQCRRDKCQLGYYRSEGVYRADKRRGSIAYTLYPRKMSVDQAGNNRMMLPSVIGHFNKSAERPLDTAQIRSIIRKELFLFGPTTLALPLTEEFLHYDSGIFHPYPGKDFDSRIIYWHVVRLIGWGHDEKDRLFWVAVNSFGEQWGENGLFRVDTSLLEVSKKACKPEPRFQEYGLEYETGLL